MNSGTLVGSLIFAAVLVVVIAVVIQLMMRGWVRRARRQAELIGELPGVPDKVGTATATLQGVYVGCTLSPAWNDRVTAGDLGYRSKAALTRYPEGILLKCIRATPIWIPHLDPPAVYQCGPHRAGHGRKGRGPQLDSGDPVAAAVGRGDRHRLPGQQPG